MKPYFFAPKSWDWTIHNPESSKQHRNVSLTSSPRWYLSARSTTKLATGWRTLGGAGTDGESRSRLATGCQRNRNAQLQIFSTTSMAIQQEPIHWRYLPYIRPFFEAYVREYAQKLWPYMAQHLHFWILDFPLTSTGQSWDPKSETDFCSVWAKLEFYRVRLPVHHRHPSTLRIFLTVRPSAVPTAASSARASTATRQASCRWSSRLRRCRSLPCRDWACFFSMETWVKFGQLNSAFWILIIIIYNYINNILLIYMSCISCQYLCMIALYYLICLEISSFGRVIQKGLLWSWGSTPGTGRRWTFHIPAVSWVAQCPGPKLSKPGCIHTFHTSWYTGEECGCWVHDHIRPPLENEVLIHAVICVSHLCTLQNERSKQVQAQEPKLVCFLPEDG
jgi:hypothetical protein